MKTISYSQLKNVQSTVSSNNDLTQLSSYSGLIKSPIKSTKKEITIGNSSGNSCHYLNFKRKRNYKEKEFVTPIHSKSKFNDEDFFNLSCDSNISSSENNKKECSQSTADDLIESNYLQLKYDLSINPSSTIIDNTNLLNNSCNNKGQVYMENNSNF